MSQLVELRIGESLSIQVKPGMSLLEICDYYDTHIPFSCRAGSCGTCLVEVLRGSENLSPLTDNEEILLPELTDNPSARLACQAKLLGPVYIAPLPHDT